MSSVCSSWENLVLFNSHFQSDFPEKQQYYTPTRQKFEIKIFTSILSKSPLCRESNVVTLSASALWWPCSMLFSCICSLSWWTSFLNRSLSTSPCLTTLCNKIHHTPFPSKWMQKLRTNKVVSWEFSRVTMSRNLWAGTDGMWSFFLHNGSLLAQEGRTPPVACTASVSDTFRDSFTASNNWFTVKKNRVGIVRRLLY